MLPQYFHARVHPQKIRSTLFSTAPSRRMKWLSRFWIDSTHYPASRRGRHQANACSTLTAFTPTSATA